MKIKTYTLDELADKYGEKNVYIISDISAVCIVGESYSEYLCNLGKTFTAKHIEEHGAYTGNEFIATYYFKVINDSEELE